MGQNILAGRTFKVHPRQTNLSYAPIGRACVNPEGMDRSSASGISALHGVYTRETTGKVAFADAGSTNGSRILRKGQWTRLPAPSDRLLEAASPAEAAEKLKNMGLPEAVSLSEGVFLAAGLQKAGGNFADRLSRRQIVVYVNLVHAKRLGT